MTRREFVKLRKSDWDQFEQLVAKLERKRRRRLTQENAETFSQLFRLVCNDLAVVRAQRWSGELADYLNALVARGHDAFYTAPPGRFAELGRYLATGFPRMFRRYIAYFWVACGLFFVPLIVTWLLVWNDPSLAPRILPREQLIQMENMYNMDPERSHGELSESRAMMAGFYVRNNVGIALKAFGSGILLGLPTIYVMLFNGVVLGAASGYIVSASHDHAIAFTSFIISHGSFELTAIAVAGGGGLMLGDSILHRGRLTLSESLGTKGVDAAKIGAGAAVMLMIAALIEAFWSPAPLPSAVKYMVGTGLWVVVIAYLAFAGRGTEGELVADEE